MLFDDLRRGGTHGWAHAFILKPGASRLGQDVSECAVGSARMFAKCFEYRCVDLVDDIAHAFMLCGGVGRVKTARAPAARRWQAINAGKCL